MVKKGSGSAPALPCFMLIGLCWDPLYTLESVGCVPKYQHFDSSSVEFPMHVKHGRYRTCTQACSVAGHRIVSLVASSSLMYVFKLKHVLRIPTIRAE